MTPPDMALALERHATSKLPDEQSNWSKRWAFAARRCPPSLQVALLTLKAGCAGTTAGGWWSIMV
jgi:DNA mismatch repair protein MutL